jgi:hypothetical protein
MHKASGFGTSSSGQEKSLEVGEDKDLIQDWKDDPCHVQPSLTGKTWLKKRVKFKRNQVRWRIEGKISTCMIKHSCIAFYEKKLSFLN